MSRRHVEISHYLVSIESIFTIHRNPVGVSTSRQAAVSLWGCYDWSSGIRYHETSIPNPTLTKFKLKRERVAQPCIAGFTDFVSTSISSNAAAFEKVGDMIPVGSSKHCPPRHYYRRRGMSIEELIGASEVTSMSLLYPPHHRIPFNLRNEG